MPELDIIGDFLSALQSQKGFSDNTLSAYRSDLTQFADFLTKGRISAPADAGDWSAVTQDDVMSFVLHLRERGYTQTTVARKLAAIKSFFKYMVASGRLAANPAEDMASLHVDRTLPHTVPITDVERLMSSLNTAGDSPETVRDRAMFQLLYATGLRAGEMVALNVGDLDMDAGAITAVAGRGKSRRIVINSRLALESLHEYLRRSRPILARAAGVGANLTGEEAAGAALFLNHRGQRLTRQGFWLILKAHATSAGLSGITPHILRHSFAAQKLQGGADIKDLQKILGHANVSTTQIYTRIEGGGKSKDKGDTRRGERKAG